MRRTRLPIRASLTLAHALLLISIAFETAPFSGRAVVLPPGLSAAQSNHDLILSFPTAALHVYTIQSSPDFLQPWTNLSTVIAGDGTTKTTTISNAVLGGRGFYRILVQTPSGLTLPQDAAFAVLGHSCGGIKEQTYVTGFDPSTGYPMGQVHLSTTCSTGGRGSPTATFTAWAAVTWDFGGNVISSGALSNAVATNPSFVATDAYGDTIYNANSAAYLVVPLPPTPTGVTAVQSGDQFQVAWEMGGVNPGAVASSTVTATPINSTAPVLVANVTGSATTALIPNLQPDTTYQVTVVSSTLAGSSPASAPVSVTTSVASIPPSAPSGVAAQWLVADPTGTTDTPIATWQAADPGNSPVDEYQIKISSDGGTTLTQTVSGTVLTASFDVDYVPNWSVTVQAHNAAGWGPVSSGATLGGL